MTTCFVCNEEFNEKEGHSDWLVNGDGRCLDCYSVMLFDLFGGLLEPEFYLPGDSWDLAECGWSATKETP